ncbi:N-acetylmuramoyl-L-alanine amidase [Metabacillus sediminilitoris]|uniref:N-acetylmuramoyl-L-alanine amidase n=1 Tax=Metabacillus sediminilitoris TaxID=2567941 RepID=A0A4S4C1M8_9BACI|nr:N-acetylmuramoyl-L-alanine amidase [Metabacillus sediminilitoris]QGQ48088.1 N-acetylmuramoyl-L-alanine amidase [Metabacillus sediminilitoris]THF81550.1 N-acetylmuramoyl-L-alanine amidase [Metabacillus sediminilitoris]
MKLYLDPGHGGSDPGAGGHGLKEKDIALDIALKIRSILTTQYENIQVKMSRTGDTTKSLSERINEANAWGADFYLSIHCNAFNGSARGYEDYIHTGLSDSSTTATYQNIIHAEVIKLNQLQDRGKKKANFYVLRETAMHALLSENGFIDNAQDAALMKQSSWRQKVAQGHANGIAKAFNLKRKQQQDDPDTGTEYKVIAGSFKSRDNADERVTFLRSKGIESFVDTVSISGVTWYRVQAGAFSSLDNAEKRLEEVKMTGIRDAFIIAEDSRGTEDVEIPSGYSILGQTFLSPEHMNLFVKNINPDALELGIYYSTFGEYYGIRGDIAFAQAMHETDYLRFTGVVHPKQNNFCGLGATGPDNPGASFETPKEGVLAHLQHLYAYASIKPLPDEYPLVDPRFDLVARGSAPSWVGLNGKWAVPSTTYGQSILGLYEKMIINARENLENVLKEVKG